MKKAIAYVSDIILGRTGEVIRRDCQVELISQYAADNDIEIIGWFEDEVYDEDVLMRPGIQGLLGCDRPYEMVLCERVWALSRSMAALEPFFKELERRAVRFECATTMWDCVSQKCRHRYYSRSAGESHATQPGAAVESTVKVRTKRPAHLHFSHLVK
ncbi:MAG TPA: recombinase family protein [Acidobacteriota bacterium]|nr:recombinase family protein [Acidobacteriota bacterium]